MRIPNWSLLALGFAGALSLSAVAAEMVTVVQKGRAFQTATLELKRGDTVSFNNEDKFVHQIYVESPAFNYESDEQPPGTDVALTFSKAGVFEVRCHIHPKMLLNVDVH